MKRTKEDCSMALAHTFKEKDRTNDVLITESVDFSALLLSRDVLKGLQDAGFQKPSPIQLKAIPLGRCGLDLIVQAKSGTGKTCVFTVIALENVDVHFLGIQVLVLAPTREIALQIEDVVKTVGKSLSGLKCHAFIGGLAVLHDKVLAKKCHIAIGTPGRVKQLIESGALDTTSIRLFVLDEADILLEGDFQEPINWIYSSLPANKQILALSATYPEYLAHHLAAYMRNPTFVRLNTADPALLGIKQFHISVPDHALPNVVFNSKTEMVIKLLSSINFQQCLIFSNMQTRAKNLQSELQSRKWPTACIAGCLDQKDRNFAMEQLKTYKCRILISTDLTSRGIDADKVNLVINMDIPIDHETYLHRIGRGGRFGSHGAAITIITGEKEHKQLRDIEKKCNTRIKKLPEPIPKDLIARVKTISLDEIVSSEQIINKPQEIQAEAGKESESDSFIRDSDIDNDLDNVCEVKGALPKSAAQNCAHIPEGLLTQNMSLSFELKEKETVDVNKDKMLVDRIFPYMLLSHELEKKKTFKDREEIPVDPMPPIIPDKSPDHDMEEKETLEGSKEIQVDPMPPIIFDKSPDHDMEEKETLESSKEIPVDPMPPIISDKSPDHDMEEKETLEGSKEIPVDPMPPIISDESPDHDMEEKETLEGSKEIPVDPMPPIIHDKSPDHDMEQKETLEGSKEIPVDPMPPIIPDKSPHLDMEQKETLEGSKEIPVDPMPPIIPDKSPDHDMEEKEKLEGSKELPVDPMPPIISDESPDHDMEEKETLEGSKEIPVDPMPPIIHDKSPDHDMEEKETLEGSKEIPVDPMPPIIPDKSPDHDMEQKETLEGSKEIPVDTMPPIIPDKSPDHDMEEKETLEGIEEITVDHMLPIDPDKCPDIIPALEVNKITAEPDSNESLQVADDILCNEDFNYYSNHRANISEDPETSSQDNSSVFVTGLHLANANIKEDDLLNPSLVSDFTNKSDKTFRHRRRAPRSLAVSDFLQSVNDDFLALRIKDVGAGGDSLKCNLRTFCSPDSSDRAPKKSDEIIGQGSPKGRSKGNKKQCEATSMTHPSEDLGSGSVISTGEMCSVDTNLLVSLASTKISLTGDNHCTTDSSLRALSNVLLEESFEASPHEPAITTVQEQNTLPNKSNVETDLKDYASAVRKSSNSSGKASGVDFNEVTSALNLYLAQRVRGNRPSSYDDLVADHKAFCDGFDKDNIEAPELSHLFEHLELKDTVVWQEVFDYDTKKIGDFQSNFNKKLKANEAERLLSKETAVEKSIPSKTQRAISEASQKNNNASWNKHEEENCEESPSLHQGKGKGKKQKNKAHKPSDSLDWRIPKGELGAQQNDKVISPVKKHIGKVEKREDFSTSAAHQITGQMSKAGSQTSESSRLKEKPSEMGKAEASERVVGRPGQQKSKGKDKECQALDDMHEMMMKRRQEQKRLKQQNLDLAKKNSETEQVISSVEIKTDPIKESQEFNNEISQAGIIEAKESSMHNSTEEVKSSIKSQQSDIDIINKSLVGSYKEDQDVVNIKNISVQEKNIDDVKLNKNLFPDAMNKSVSSKKHHANDSLGSKVLTKCTKKSKHRKPSKTQARLAGLEVSAGSTSSSSYFSLTSDMSDVVLSDMEQEIQLLKPHYYANKYVEDENCLLNDSKLSTASSVYHSYYSKEDAYLLDYSISCSSPCVPKTLLAPDPHGQHHVQETREGVTYPKLKVGAKSSKVQSLHKPTKSPKYPQEQITDDLQNNQKKASKHYHTNSTEKKQKKRNSFPSLQSCESDTESDYATSRPQGASSRRRPSHYSSLAWQHLSFEPLDSFGKRAAAQPLPLYSSFQPVFSPYMYPVPLQYFPPDYYNTALYHQWLLQTQYIKTMTKVLTDLHKQWFSDSN